MLEDESSGVVRGERNGRGELSKVQSWATLRPTQRAQGWEPSQRSLRRLQVVHARAHRRRSLFLTRRVGISVAGGWPRAQGCQHVEDGEGEDQVKECSTGSRVDSIEMIGKPQFLLRWTLALIALVLRSTMGCLLVLVMLAA